MITEDYFVREGHIKLHLHLNKTDRTLDITVETEETIMENYDKLEQPWGLKAWTEQGVVEGRYYTSTCACLCA